MSRPSIVLITADQMRADVLGVAGHPICRTPRIDAMARTGCHYPLATTPCPVCLPARVSILTGQYPTTHRSWSNHHAGGRRGTDLFDCLRTAGYRTALVGKNHTYLTPNDADIFEERPRATDRSAAAARQAWDEVFARTGNHRLVEAPAAGGPAGDPDEARTSRAIGLIDAWGRDEDHPCFIWLSLLSPHTPYVAPEPYYSMYADADLPAPAKSESPRPFRQRFHRLNNDRILPFDAVQIDRMRRVYLGMVSLVDRQVGRVLDALNHHRMGDRTLVIFCSDHGDYQGDHGLLTKGPALDESLVRVPLVVSWPGRIPAGRRSDRFASLIDILPTCCDAASISIPPDCKGESLLRDTQRSYAFAEYGIPGKPHRGPVDGYPEQRNPYDDRLPWEGNPISLAGRFRMIRDHRFKLIQDHGDDALYDLELDPKEQTNLIATPQRSDDLQRLQADLHHWERSLSGIASDQHSNDDPPA